MQMFGIGLPELLLILFLSVIVIGPERLPGFAAELAQWIRRGRAYANHLTRDFNDVMGDLEKEAGASREDWKEIASVFNRQASGVTQELTKAVSQLEQASDLDSTALRESTGGTANGHTAQPPAISAEDAQMTEPEAGNEDKPWYMPERASRRRSE